MRTIVILLSLFIGVLASKPTNNATLGDLPAKERNRRLIPYMTYYLSQGQNQPYRAVMAVPYIAVPQYRQSIPQRYIQQPSSLTRMITQNYLAMSKLGNQRTQQPRFNPNYPQELKYYVPLQNSQVNTDQYQKLPATFQYLKPQISEQETEYEQQEQESPVEQYGKPSADEIIQFAKPEVQQYVTKPEVQQYVTKPEVQRYVTKYPEPILQYSKDSDYETGPQTQVPQYITKPIQPQQYAIKDDSPYYLKKPSTQYVHKLPQGQLKLGSHLAEYSSKPLSSYNLQDGKEGQASFTITQSQEIEVEPMQSTPAPAAKYHATYVADPEHYNPYQSYYDDKVEEDEPEVIDRNINDILRGGVSLSKTLPDKITTENLDSSIKTLSKILRILQAAHSLPHSAKTIITNFPNPNEVRVKDPHVRLPPVVQGPKDDSGSTPGRPGVDYPAYDEIPETHFSCKDQRYKGFFGDPETRCQVWHYCDLNGGQASFLCPNGTIFSQVALTCDWWFNVKCASTAQLYVLNERLYKFILPQKPSFPEDYAGPLVDRYLTQKFKEIEEKNKNKTEEVSNNDEEFEPPYSIDLVSKNKVRSTG